MVRCRMDGTAPRSAKPRPARAMSSPVHWAALGLVIERPAYGAELCRRYEAEYAALLPVTGASHIYTALNELERRGYIEEFPGKCGTASSSRLPLPYYRATDVGIEAYGRRLEEQVAFELRKQGIWVRQLSIFADDPETALGLLARLRSRFLDGLGGGHA